MELKTKEIIDAMYAALDAETFELLMRHGITANTVDGIKEQMKKAKLELVVEIERGTESTTYIYKLCSVIDTKRVKVDFKICT